MPAVNMKAVLNDIKEAINRIIKEASRYHGTPDAMILSGHSAGGHLALMAYLMNENLRPNIRAILQLKRHI